MKAGATIEKLLIVFYQIHQESGVVRQYGIYPWNLTGESGIRFSDGGDDLAAVTRMKKRSWIQILNDPRAKRVESWHKIQLTEEGISYAEKLLKPAPLRYLRDIYVATIEGIARAFKK